MKRVWALLVVGIVLFLFGVVTVAASWVGQPTPRGFQNNGVAYYDPNNQIPTVYRIYGDGLSCLITKTGGIWCK